MGDRVSISFRNGGDESVTLFSHWGGMGFVREANRYVAQLKDEISGQITPLARREPDTVMVDFIRHITAGMDRVGGNWYLGKTDSDGDNSDNGHHEIDLA